MMDSQQWLRRTVPVSAALACELKRIFAKKIGAKIAVDILMHFFPRLARRATTQQAGADDSELLFFTPEQIVAGIAFHLIDNSSARGVDGASRDAVLENLCQRIQSLCISQDQWDVMDNFQRLQWLLEKSQVMVNLNPFGTATLRAR